MSAEIQLIREMIDRAATYGKIETFECQKTAAMLRTAANVMDNWNRKMLAYEKALRQISNHDTPGYLFRTDGKSRVDQLPVAVDQAEAGNWPTPTVQEAGKIGNQANYGQLGLSNHPALRGEVMREKFEKNQHGQAAQVSPSTHGSRPGLLNPDWVETLMGLPVGWTDFA